MRGGGSARPGVVYHFISRFVAGEWFVESAVERRTYLSLLGFAMRETDWRCFSFAIMSSHIHLGLVAGTRPLDDWLRPMHSAFATYINERRHRIGGIFVKGPQLIAVRSEGVPYLIHYIHNNPVRAGVVAHARDSDWTSHEAYVGVTYAPSWLDVEGGLARAGFTSGHALESWMTEIRVEREHVEALRVVAPRPPGRPRTGPGAVASAGGPDRDPDPQPPAVAIAARSRAGRGAAHRAPRVISVKTRSGAAA